MCLLLATYGYSSYCLHDPESADGSEDVDVGVYNSRSHLRIMIVLFLFIFCSVFCYLHPQTHDNIHFNQVLERESKKSSTYPHTIPSAFPATATRTPGRTWTLFPISSQFISTKFPFLDQSSERRHVCLYHAIILSPDPHLRLTHIH